MRRFLPTFLLVPALLALLLILPSCGGGTPKANIPASITMPLSTVSLNKGDVYQLSPTAQDKNGATVLAQFSYSTDNTNLVNVSTGGLLCAGTWDTKFIVCTPTTGTGTANITISTGGVSTKVAVTVHDKVDSVQIDPLSTDCVSSAGTLQLTAKAYSLDPAVCTSIGEGAPPCQLPSNTLGNFVWTSNSSTVVTFDNNTNIGLATAGSPGQTTVYATVSSNNSPAVTFTTCPVASLTIATSSGSTAPFSLAKSGTQTLVAKAVDSKGVTLTTAPITWTSSQSFALSVASTTTTPQTATVTANNPGTASLIASCTSPTCNIGLDPLYSNLIVGDLTGTSNDTLYVASQDSLSMVPIDLANNNALGTTITLGAKPNSLQVARNASLLALGADATTSMTVNPTNNTVTNLNFVGTALGFSPDSALMAFSIPSLNNVTIISTSSTSGAAALPVTTGSTNLRVGFAPDSHSTFLTQGNSKMAFWNRSAPVQTVTLAGTANDVDFLATGHAAYLAGGAPGQVTAQATCNPFLQVDTKAAANPQLVRAIPDGSGILVAEPSSIVVISPISADNACPTNITSTANTYTTGITNPTALLVTPDSSTALITDGSGTVYVFNISAHTTKAVALSGSVSATYQADITLDSKNAYVGASDGKVHKIDLSAGNDVGQIDPKLKQSDGTTTANPHFVGLRHKP